MAFLKATDLDLMTEDIDNPLVRMLATITRLDAERQVLEKCHGNKMDKIVTPLDSGQSNLVSKDGVKEPLFWLALELADSDARIQRSQISTYEFNWTCKTMHNLSTAVQQLHSIGVSHNNIKPSALLIFGPLKQKLGDLADAIASDIYSPLASKTHLGDPRYMAPEFLYEASNVPNEYARKMNDLYLLGSVGYFLVTGVMLTPALLGNLGQEQRPRSQNGGWGDGFNNILPYVREAHTEAIEELANIMPSDLTIRGRDYATEYVAAISELTDPDPMHRGHPVDREQGRKGASLERYVSLFDRLSSVAKILQ